jgi:hypothetical protein
VLLIVEDLHWVDPSTLELLGLLGAQAAMARLYVLLTWRPEFQPPWPPPAHQTTLTLGCLLPAQVEQLATHVAGGKALPPAVVEQIAARTEGVPLFVEELAQMVLDVCFVNPSPVFLLDKAGDEGPLPRRPIAVMLAPQSWCQRPCAPTLWQRGVPRRAFLSDPDHTHGVHGTPLHGAWLHQGARGGSVLARRFGKRGACGAVADCAGRLGESLEV